jgi:hypothetical protein
MGFIIVVVVVVVVANGLLDMLPATPISPSGTRV